MINPADIDLIGTEEGKEIFPEELLVEFEDGKGDDEEEAAENAAATKEKES